MDMLERKTADTIAEFSVELCSQLTSEALSKSLDMRMEREGDFPAIAVSMGQLETTEGVERVGLWTVQLDMLID